MGRGTPRRKVLQVGILAALLGLVALGCESPAGVSPDHTSVAPGAQPAVITVDGGQPQQAIQGFGAYEKSLVYGSEDFLTPDLRSKALAALYQQVRLNTGNLDGSELLESPGSYEQRQNDDGDPMTINRRGFQSAGADGLKAKLLDPARPLGLTDHYLGVRISSRWASPWLTSLKERNYDAFLDEAAEQVVATVRYWRETLGVSTDYLMPFNEPLSGNRELEGGQVNDVVALVKRVGGRLEREGLGIAKFVVGNEETEEASLRTATAVLNDPAARRYAGAIGYHTYPYGSSYSGIAKVLDGPGRGRPDRAAIDVRERLLELGARHGLPVWMTEVSDPQWEDARSFDTLRARAIHIHDELTYANAAVYQGMMSMWDSRSHAEHFNGDTRLYRGDGHVVLVDLKAGSVTITGMGHAIGHYARWITPGQTVRLPATSTDPLILATAFRDAAKRRVALVIVNNAETERAVRIDLQGLRVSGDIAGEQSTSTVRWSALAPFPAPGAAITAKVPPRSVTSLAGALAG